MNFKSANPYPERKVVTRGNATVAIITVILFQVMQLYRICRFASEKKVLNVLFPKIKRPSGNRP
jgi:hypothetical protein